jgi:predicted DCC family thiol-disulfide oxidoreductase YuxK
MEDRPGGREELRTGPVLLYDGTCGFCAGSIRFVLGRDRKRTLRFAALDSAFGRAALQRHPEVRGVDSVLWLEPVRGSRPEEVFTRSNAALRVTAYLGGIWRLGAAGRIVPRPLRDAVYDLVAKHRHRLSRGGEQCLVPSPEQRARFLD